MDPLSAFFVLLIALGGFMAAVYSIGYMKIYREAEGHSLASYHVFMGALIAAMLAVAVVQNALLFLMAWEAMSLASWFLVAFEDRKEEARRAGLYYLVAMHLGAGCLVAAFAWGGVLTGSMDFDALKAVPAAHPAAASVLFLLFFAGFGTKAGFVPLHTWLPLAHPAAPTGVSALMSGVMIKTGIYGLLRILLLLGVPAPWLAYLVFGIALASGILGVMNAIAQHDLKKLLAYHSIENIGIIGLGAGLGMLGLVTGREGLAVAGFLGALLHTFNHFTFKSLLFYGAGAVYVRARTRDIEKLGGLARILPATAAFFLLGSLAICGLPLLNGFISEFAIFWGLAHALASGGGIAVALAAAAGLAGLAFIGAMALLCFTKAFGIVFLGSPRSNGLEDPQGEPAAMLAPMAGMAVLIVAVGLGAPLVLPLLAPVVGQFVPAPGAWEAATAVFLPMSRALWALGGLILAASGLRWALGRGRAPERFKTWDCGYQAADPKIQYTASSFASPFLSLVTGFVPQKRTVVPPEGPFPAGARLESHGLDALDRWLVAPLVSVLDRSLGLFSWVQSGRTQQYILYGLVTLVALVVWVIWAR
jgi:formate hydrogenlyase subunit 3/multisubunit Na+/H+ antiporter MnhD subunit